jgi:anhydro-N-acetylmuramic acid kinase
MSTYTALGIMSGSSLDGLDLAFCEFTKEKDSWTFQIKTADTLPYPEEWKMLLQESIYVSGEKLLENNVAYGKFLGEKVHEFLDKNHLSPDIIALHGHTVFHQPEKGFSLQLGSGQAIAIATGIETVSDFRNKDILLGGQGAPLVPIGDKLLFAEYDYCVNFGGIANISFEQNGQRLGYDVCAANQLLNHLSRQMGLAYDKNGETASLGKLDKSLFDELNKVDFCQKPYPKSLSNEQVRELFLPILDNSQALLEDKLYTTVKHIACQINNATDSSFEKKMLLTGGGARNGFLVEAIRRECPQQVYVPDTQIIDFKEALIFAFMGILRKTDRINCLASATGAKRDSSTGVIYLP